MYSDSAQRKWAKVVWPGVRALSNWCVCTVVIPSAKIQIACLCCWAWFAFLTMNQTVDSATHNVPAVSMMNLLCFCSLNLFCFTSIWELHSFYISDTSCGRYFKAETVKQSFPFLGCVQYWKLKDCTSRHPSWLRHAEAIMSLLFRSKFSFGVSRCEKLESS